MWILEGGEEKFLLGLGSWTVGRVECSINLSHDLSISRKHATLTVTVEGHLIIEDNQSKYGTFLSGIRIEGRIILKSDEPCEGKVVVRFGAVKSEFRIARETWRVAMIGRFKNASLIPRLQTAELAEANLVILGDGYIRDCKKAELMGLALAWLRKMPIVTESFLQSLPQVPIVVEHAAVMPFTHKRLEQCSGIYCSGREELILGFGGSVSNDPRDAVDETLLVEFLYGQRSELPQCQRTSLNEMAKVYEISKVNVIYSDSLFRKQTLPIASNTSGGGVNTKRFKKVQPERALPVIIDMIENCKPALMALNKKSNDFGDGFKAATSKTTAGSRRKRKIPLFEDYQEDTKITKEPAVAAVEKEETSAFQSDFFKKL